MSYFIEKLKATSKLFQAFHQKKPEGARSVESYRFWRRNEFRRQHIIQHWRNVPFAHEANLKARIKERIEWAAQELAVMQAAGAHAIMQGLGARLRMEMVRGALRTLIQNAIKLRPSPLTNAYRRRMVKELGLA